ncbi:MAG TPA: family 43 glycosylhydrolase [Bacteroidales bacterium]|nr:family 43 glycosylhydrolase [Bacteroidales bacterium]
MIVWSKPDIGPTSDTIHNTGLIISRMKDLLIIEGPQVVLSEPEHDWEIQRYSVNEGVAVIKSNNKIFIAFSASATDHNYAVGLLWAHVHADLLDPASWTKLPRPVFYTNPELAGMAQDTTVSPLPKMGKPISLYIMQEIIKKYRGIPYKTPTATPGRVLNWTEDGFPDFGQNIRD